MSFQLFFGDCLDILKATTSSSIDLVLTDPPYGMEYQSNFREEQHEKIENDDNLDWLPLWLNLIKKALKPDGHVYFFCSFHHLDTFMIETKKVLNLKNLIIWEKNNTSMGDLFGDYAPKFEIVLFCTQMGGG